jgi:hypothetical protein
MIKWTSYTPLFLSPRFPKKWGYRCFTVRRQSQRPSICLSVRVCLMQSE